MVTIFGYNDASCQEVKKKTIRSKVEYFKDQEKNDRLVTTLKVKEDRNAPLENANVYYYCIGDTSEVLLDSITTNIDGEAILVLKNYNNIYADSAGVIQFEARYLGDKSYKHINKDIEIQLVDMNLSFFQKDTIKYILAELNTLRPDQKLNPIEGADILIYIKGTFSLLPIGKEETDAQGKAIMEFPVDMPGDSVGMLTIVSKIEDDDDYGNIEAIGKINWGKPVPLAVEQHRGLGDTDAPLWMVYTLIVLLSAVWFHYLYIIFMIIKIKMARTDIQSKLELLES
jgi:hypothetical protein